MNTLATRSLALGLLALSSSVASAAITATTGGVNWLLSPPPSCVPLALTGFTAYTWDEKQNVNLALNVDMVNNPGSSNAPIPGTISGTYASHFLHFDPNAAANPVSGTITYNAPIVAVIFRNINLDNSDGPAGALTTVYPTGFTFRGLIAAPSSFVTISGNLLTFNLNTINPVYNIAQVRVITQTPAPGATALLGFAGIACMRRRRPS
jgi:MYXO-CTERM domain-containing protein